MPITEQQLQERKKYIGSSDSAAILGVCPYKSATDIYLEKLSLVENKFNSSDAIEIGNELEESILKWFAKKQGFKIYLNDENNSLFRVHANGIMAANFDALVVGDDTQSLEAKTHAVVSGRIDEEWGEVGTDEVPDRIAIQCQHQMAVVPTLQVVWVPVLLGGVGLRHYRIKRNNAIIAGLEEINLQFWRNHVELHVPPDGFAPSLESIKTLKRVPKKTVSISDQLVNEWLQAKDAATVAEKIKKEKELAMLQAFEDAELATCSSGEVSYFETFRKGFTVEPTSFRTLRFKKLKTTNKENENV